MVETAHIKISAAISNLSLTGKNINDAARELPPFSRQVEELTSIKSEIADLQARLMKVRLNG